MVHRPPPIIRAVIYARYSTDNQREASIADQVEVCRRYAERQGWTVAEIYDDRALSGASRMRPGFLRLLADAEVNKFDIVLCEAVDRLGRNLSDVAGLHDRLSFHRIKLFTTSAGEITPMHIGIMGTMAQMQLADLGDKTRRGLLGRVRAGRSAGGLAYGYEVVAPRPGSKEAGERRIKPTEAAVVQRIFRDYAAGRSPRFIAHTLNAEGVPGPDGRTWIDTTIRGQVERGTGILNNTLYIGRLSWNRCSFVKDPRTGKRVARVNPPTQWEETEIPELRIIEQDLWDQVRARQSDLQHEIARDDAGNRLNQVHRHEFLLAGLLACGGCGGAYIIIGQDRYGCATRRGKATCDNAHTITRQRIEARVLGGLKDRLLAPDLVEEFIRAFAEETAALQREAAGQRGRLEAELKDIERRLQGVLRAIENGAWNETLRARLTELETRQAALRTELEAAAPASVVRLHPNAAGVYRAQVAELEQALNAPEIRAEAAEALRALMARVVLTPDADAPDGLRAELHGELAAILALGERAATGGKAGRAKLAGTGVPGSQLSVVAGTRNHLCRTAFRWPSGHATDDPINRPSRSETDSEPSSPVMISDPTRLL